MQPVVKVLRQVCRQTMDRTDHGLLWADHYELVIEEFTEYFEHYFGIHHRFRATDLESGKQGLLSRCAPEPAL